MNDFDLIVIGGGPGGHRAAVQAAKLGARVALVERQPVVGGACVQSGTLPSKTLHESVRYASGLKRRALERRGMSLTMSALLDRKTQVVHREIDLREGQLHRNHITVITGNARFESASSVVVTGARGEQCSYRASHFVVATGSRPAKPRFWSPALDDARILDSDSVLHEELIPETLTVLGGGVIGCEYACIFAALGTKVTLVDRRERLLRFMDREVTETLAHVMRSRDICFKLGESLEDIGYSDDGRVQTRLRSGKVIRTQKMLIAMGRSPNTEGLGLEAAGVETDELGRPVVDENFLTKSSGKIYAVGDIIGFPALASTSMKQGRHASAHAFSDESLTWNDDYPFGVYTMPEVAYVGKNEEELTAQEVPYEVGRAEFGESSRGKISGAQSGFVKLLFHRETLALLGVHILGEGATELVHIGQAVMAHGGTVRYFADNIFNYPTLAECYVIAALNGLNRL